MPIPPTKPQRGFTLMETVIAIGVIALLITGFVAVFAPAVEGIRRSISAEEANRLTSTLEQELVTVRQGQLPANPKTGFEKGFQWILQSNLANTAVVVYQYRGAPNSNRPDDTPTPVPSAQGIPGRDFITVSMVRRVDDPSLAQDLEALEGRPFVVRLTQLIYDPNGALIRNPNANQIADPKNPGQAFTQSDPYPEAVIAFAADFYSLPNRSPAYLRSAGFQTYFNTRMTRPMFTRNLAIRR